MKFYKVQISTNFKNLYSVLFVYSVALVQNRNHFVGNKGNNSFECIILESNLECPNSLLTFLLVISVLLRLDICIILMLIDIYIHDKRIPTMNMYAVDVRFEEWVYGV